MTPQIEKKNVEELPKTDSPCPWCGGMNLRQDPEVRVCPECPFSAQYPSDLSDAPPHIIKAYANYEIRAILEDKED